ncbi:MAG: HEPN domain-containing protein [Candidatus Aenigmarchaeota archaeon]|nr:HEPN domain-containing protein [Candidatus Aenigmarchaeota archaeon]
MKRSMEFEKCLERRRLVRQETDSRIVDTEIRSAEYDLERAKKSFAQGDFKWGIIQAYYCIFHSAKALVCRKGYKEKSHHCLLVALRHLYCDPNEADPDLAEIFENSMGLREEADYEMSFSEQASRIIIGDAERFLKAAKAILDARK